MVVANGRDILAAGLLARGHLSGTRPPHAAAGRGPRAARLLDGRGSPRSSHVQPASHITATGHLAVPSVTTSHNRRICLNGLQPFSLSLRADVDNSPLIPTNTDAYLSLASHVALARPFLVAAIFPH